MLHLVSCIIWHPVFSEVNSELLKIFSTFLNYCCFPETWDCLLSLEGELKSLQHNSYLNTDRTTALYHFFATILQCLIETLLINLNQQNSFAWFKINLISSPKNQTQDTYNVRQIVTGARQSYLLVRTIIAYFHIWFLHQIVVLANMYMKILLLLELLNSLSD